jgi:conjugal transfer/entry exclusion protein
MTQARNTPEPSLERELTIKDVIDKIDGLSQEVKNLSTEVKTFDEKFKNYQQATQWVVQLAFTLIASATVTVIITSVVK